MKRRYEVEITKYVTVEIDDEVTSDFYKGETVMTAHQNLERFDSTATLKTAIGSVGLILADGRSLSNTDGWADFPDGAATLLGEDTCITSVRESRR